MKRTSKRIIAITLAVIITLSLMVTGLSAVSASTRVPYAPTGVFTRNSGTGFYITWRAAANATGYKVYYKTAESDWSVEDTNTTSVNLENLEYGTLYYIQVQSIGVNGIAGGFNKVSSMTHVRGTTLTSLVYNTNRSVTLGWDEAEGANGYAIAKYHAGKFVNYFYTTDTTYTDYTTVGGTVYAYQINPYYSNGKSAAYAYWTKASALTTLYRPTVHNVNSTPENMNINWNKIDGAKTYQVAFMRKGDTAWNKRITASSYYNIPYPTQGATYYIQVQPINGNIAGPWSEVNNHDIEPLGVPTITGIDTTYDKITFNWDAVKDAKAYDIAFRRTVDGEDVWHHKTATATDTSLSVNNPTPGTTYTVKIRALCGKIEGEYSETSDSDIPVLGTPAITGINSTYEKMTVNWNAVDDATGYEIAYKRTTDADTAWNLRQTTATSYSVSEPTPTATYTVKVRALYNSVKGNESQVKTHNISALGVPEITDINSTVEKLNITWSKADGATSYYIAFRRTVDGEDVWHHKTSTGTSISVDKPTQGTTYTVKVCAVRNNNYGEYSEISTNDIPVLGVPQNVSITSTIKWISINWNKADNATSYIIAIMRSTDKDWTHYTTTDTSYMYENPVKGATYYIQVQALCGSVAGNYTKVNTQVIPEKDPHEGLTYYEAGETVKVTHPAETELVWVVDEAAHDETKTEIKSVYHYRICQGPGCGAIGDGWTAEEIKNHDWLVHGIEPGTSIRPFGKPKSGYVDEPVDTILHVAEKGHYEVKVIKEAWEEEVTIAQSGWYKTVTHPAETAQAKVIDKAAYYYEEPVYEYTYPDLCWGCDANVDVMSSKERAAHMSNHHQNGEISGYRQVMIKTQVDTKRIETLEETHFESVITKQTYNELVFVLDK